MKKVLLVANSDWFLYNYRLSLAKTLRDADLNVVFVSPPGTYVGHLRKAGFRWIPWRLDRRSVHPVRELAALWRLVRIYCMERPELLHHFTIKPITYGSLAARLMSRLNRSGRRPVIVNTLSGLGFVFTDDTLAAVLRSGLVPLLRWTLRTPQTWTVVQNSADRQQCLRRGLAEDDRLEIIASVGVDLDRFAPNGRVEAARPTTVILLAARMLWDKGVGEFVEAARRLRHGRLAAEFWLAGEPDLGNPTCIPRATLEAWARQGVIRWLGHVENMPALLQQADVAVLPSYHEGLPRFLLEAAASGLPIVATDIPGCRQVVRDGENGFLVPLRDPTTLALAVARLIGNLDLRLRMGQASRALAEREFDEHAVLGRWLDLYRRVLE